MEKKDWFSSWFDTPYYHILYKDRNDEEAQLFMRNITSFLSLKKRAHILDLPCGKGRHSIFLNSLGYKVTGGDLSENSINFAKNFENENLKFITQDMRKSFDFQFDAVFNLFTSFGYFEKETDDILVLQNMKKSLKKNGVLVLDFLNVELAKKKLIKEETKSIDGVNFTIFKEIVNGFIVKHIRFNDQGKSYHFTEYVKYIDLEKFQDYFFKANLKLKHTFGDYNLNSFNKEISDRLILVATL